MALVSIGCSSTRVIDPGGAGGAPSVGVGGTHGGTGGVPPTGGAGGARVGSCGTSYADALPSLPMVLTPPTSLGPSDGLARGSCRALLDNGTTSTLPGMTEIVGAAGHASGRFYYEATFLQFVSGWSSIGVSAPPERVGAGPLGGAFQKVPPSSAAVFADGPDVIGVAADIDAGAVFFYVNGRLDSQSTISRLPGVGAYSPSIVSMIGTAIDVNFGQVPFAFAIPDGYAAWATNLAADSEGACIAEQVPRPPTAPITGRCDAPTVSTFTSMCGGGLVALGIYTTDSSNGNNSEGTTLVHVMRQGHTTLGLSAYEPTHWIIDAAAGAVVDRVIAFGFYTPRVDAPPGTVVTISSDRITGGFQWPFDDGGDDTQGYVTELERTAGAPLTMFGGCYAATELTVGD